MDGCALDPVLALRRNGEATGVLATACAERGIDLVAISTNEVFDGRRTDGRGYQPSDPPAPGNAYGASKLDGERRAQAAFAGASGASLGIVRTAWLFGTPGRDFPSRILAAADRAIGTGEPLRVVGDEWGTPTYVVDCAEAIVELLAADAVAGIHHVVNGHFAARADWARYVVARAGLDVEVVERPDGHLGAPLDAAALGRPGADALALRRAPSSLAGRDGRLCAHPAARDAGPRRQPGRRG